MNFSNEEILRTLEGIYNRENDENLNISPDDRTDLVTVMADLKNGETFNEMFKDSIERIFKENTIFNDIFIRDEFLDALYNSNKNKEEELEEDLEKVEEEALEESEEKTEELDENSQKLIEEIEQVQSILYTNPEDVEHYSEQEQIESQMLDQIKDRIRNNKVEEKDKTFLKNIFNKYIPTYEDFTEEEQNERINYCNDLVDNLKENKVNVEEVIEIPEEKKEIDKIIEKIQENEAYQSKFLEENKEDIIKEFIETTQKELEELEGKELTEEEQNKQRILNETLNQLDSENNINNENLKALLKARQYNENNELYLRVIDKQIEELEKQLEEDIKDNNLDNTHEELTPEERLEIKVDEENREDIIKALNEVLDEKEKTATEEEKQIIQNQKNNINNPNYKNENIESLINDNDLTQEVLESRINSIDKEIEDLVTPNPISEHIDLLNNQLQDVEKQIKEKNQEIEQAIASNDQEKAKELLAERDNIYESKKMIEKQLEGQKSKIPGYEIKRTPIDEHIDLLNSQLQDVERQIKEKNQEIEQAIASNDQEKAKGLLAERDNIYESKKMIEKQLEGQKAKVEEEKNKKVEELQNKKDKLQEDLNKVKKQKEEKQNKGKPQDNNEEKKASEEKKSNTDIQNKIDELKEKRDRIASIPAENKELRTIKDAYNTIKKDAINSLSNSESFKNATDQDKIEAISNSVENHERFNDLNLYKENKEKLIRELKEDIAKGLGLTKQKENDNEQNKEKPTEKEEKWYLKALSGAAGFGLGFGTAMVVSGIPATMIVGAAITAVNVYSSRIAEKVTAKIEKIQSAENYAKEHPIKNKLLNGVKKINKFLQSGYGKWFVRGIGAGYLVGNIYKAYNQAHKTGPGTTAGPTTTGPTTTGPTTTGPTTAGPTVGPTTPSTKLKVGDKFKIDKDLRGGRNAELDHYGSISDKHREVTISKIDPNGNPHFTDSFPVDGKKEGVAWVDRDELIESIVNGTTKRR